MSGKSEKERKFKRSACWHFYDKTPGGGFCRICQREILTQAGGTTNLRNHLRRKHGELWKATMENRLDPSTLAVSDRRSTTLTEGIAAEEESTAEANTAVHTLQAYRDVTGNTFFYLQTAEGEHQNVQVLNGSFQPVVASSESLPTNGEQLPSAIESQAVDGDPKAHEDSSRKFANTPVKNYQGSSLANRTAVRKFNRPTPVSTVQVANSNSIKEDTFDSFGRYIASMLRNLPSKNACKLQGEIVNWILKEQIKSNDN